MKIREKTLVDILFDSIVSKEVLQKFLKLDGSLALETWAWCIPLLCTIWIHMKLYIVYT